MVHLGRLRDQTPRPQQRRRQDVAELEVSISGEGRSACTGETTGPGGCRGLGQDTWLEKWLDPRNLKACIRGRQTPLPPALATKVLPAG